MAKINITIDDELLQRADNYADKSYISRSGLIALSLNQYLMQNEALIALKNMSLIMIKISETNEIDEDTKKEIESLNAFSKLFLNNR